MPRRRCSGDTNTPSELFEIALVLVRIVCFLEHSKFDISNRTFPILKVWGFNQPRSIILVVRNFRSVFGSTGLIALEPPQLRVNC